MKKISMLVLAILGGLPMVAAITVRGLVKDASGEPLIGATVMVSGTSRGTITDLDGNFELADVDEKAEIEASYAGFVSEKMTVGYHLNFVLQEDVKALEEVIVIGYGTSKIKDLTAPIETVKGEDLKSIPSSSAMSALQGKVAGVNVVNSGVPGAGPSVTIRGLGSFGTTTPLYVVDGMFYDNINFLNNADIEDISIMKDASASAIYGVRAANGVVIITTKRGKYNQRPEVTYDGYVGYQVVSNRLKMASSNQYAEMLMEAAPQTYSPLFDKVIEAYGGSYDEANERYNLNLNTNWYDELIRPALITNHSLNINGGGEKATYGLGISYFYQNGIMDVDNSYNRLNLRGNVDYKPFRWLTVGFNSVFSTSDQRHPNQAAWQQAYNMPGIFPVYDETTTYTDNYASPMTAGMSSNNTYNPVATANLYESESKSNQILANIYAQFNIWKDKINLRTAFGYDFNGMRATIYRPAYEIGQNQTLLKSEFERNMTAISKSIWDNTATYNDQWGKHAFKLMLGMSMRDETAPYLWARANNVPMEDNLRYISQGEEDGRLTGDNGTHYRALSFFGRLNYSYDGRYLLMFTLRRDGSSKYNDHWGTFPSVGAAWVLSEESWLKNNRVINFLKLRASWGLLGNDYVEPSSGVVESEITSSVFGDQIMTGYVNKSTFSWLSWEEVNETNVGLGFGLLNNRLTGDLDWYYRQTQNTVITLPTGVNQTPMRGNWAKILNMGVDFNLNWEHKINKNWTYFIGGNLGWLHNEVRHLRDDRQILIGGKTVQKVGEKMNSFYGLKVVGIYQTEEEVASDPIAVANSLQPGDFKYEDVNKDGVIDEHDKQILGSYVPDITYGFNVGFRFKGLDLTLVFTGKAGAELWNRKRALRTASSYYNFDEAQYENRWHGAGTSNTDPSAAALNKSWNISDNKNASYFVESADYFRIQNITLGYTFTNVGAGEYKMPSIRFSISAEKPYTFFKAHSMTPELTDSEGWDTEVYPIAGTYLFSVQLKF